MQEISWAMKKENFLAYLLLSRLLSCQPTHDKSHEVPIKKGLSISWVFVFKHVIYILIFKNIAIWKYNIKYPQLFFSHRKGKGQFNVYFISKEQYLFCIVWKWHIDFGNFDTNCIQHLKSNQNIPQYCTTWMPGNFSHAGLVFHQSSSISPHAILPCFDIFWLIKFIHY